MSKRIFSTVLLLILVLTACVSAQQAETDALFNFYEVDDEAVVLTVRLPANATTGYQWIYAISDEGLLKLASEAYIPDEAAEGVVGTGGTWVATFDSNQTVEGAGGMVTLTLIYCQPWDDEAPAEGYELDIWMVENGTLSVEAVRQIQTAEEVTA